MEKTDLIHKRTLYFNEALEVIDSSIDYTGKTGNKVTKYDKDEFKYYYAIDCEMVFVDKGTKIDNRKSYEPNSKDIADYIEKKTKGTNKKQNDKATTLFEYIDYNINSFYKDPGTNKSIKKVDEIHKDIERYVLSLARITIVDWNGFVIYDKFIRQKETVAWCPESSGIPNDFYNKLNRGDLKINIKGSQIDTSKDIVNFDDAISYFKTLIAQNSIIIGHNLLGSDYYAMNFDKSYIDSIKKNTRDTAFLFGYEYNYTDRNTSKEIKMVSQISLKNLIKGFLNKDIQSMLAHDPSEDSRGALALYKLFREGIESNLSYTPAFDTILYPITSIEANQIKKTNGLSLLGKIISNLLFELSKIHNEIKGSLKESDQIFLEDVRNRYIKYITHLLQ